MPGQEINCKGLASWHDLNKTFVAYCHIRFGRLAQAGSTSVHLLSEGVLSLRMFQRSQVEMVPCVNTAADIRFVPEKAGNAIKPGVSDEIVCPYVVYVVVS